jgi:hypothetical protein
MAVIFLPLSIMTIIQVRAAGIILSLGPKNISFRFMAFLNSFWNILKCAQTAKGKRAQSIEGVPL